MHTHELAGVAAHGPYHDDAPEWIKVSDAVKRFGIGRTSIYQLIRDGSIKTALLRKRGNTTGIRLISTDSLRQRGEVCRAGEMKTMPTNGQLRHARSRPRLNGLLDGNEQVLLSAMMNGAGELPLTAIDFASPPNRTIFDYVSRLPNPSLRGLTDALSEAGELENVGGAHRIAEIYNMPHDASCVNYALEQVVEASARRGAAQIGDKLRKCEISPEQAAAELLELSQRNRAEKSWTDALNESIVTSRELHVLELRPRKKLLGEWFSEGDLGIIFSSRGVGKTWFGLGIAQALSNGGKLGDWQAREPVKVLYIDGEMPPDLICQRCQGLQRDE